jgi:hypothetical protein
MAALANPVTWIVAAVLAAACAGSRGAVGRLGRLLTGTWILAALAALVVANLGVRVALGLVAPGDFSGEILAARSIAAGGPLYSADLTKDRVTLRQAPPGPLATTVASWLPASGAAQARERNHIGIAAQSHPPTVFAAVVPLVRLLGAEPAFVVVSAISVLAAAGMALCLVAAAIVRPDRPQFVLAALLVAGWQPTLAAIRDGQLSVVIAGCAIAGWWMARGGGERAGGAFVGVATALKFYPGALLFALAIRSWRAVAWAGVTCAACVIASAAIFGPQSWIAYRDMARDGALGQLVSGTNLSLAARFAHVLPRETAIQCWLVTSALLLAITAWRSVRERHVVSAFDISFARFSCLAIVLSPTAWGHYLPLLAQPFAVLLRRGVDTGHRWSLAAAAGLALLLSLPIAETTGIWSLGTIGWTNMLLSPTSAILALWAVLMVEWPAPRS